MMLKQNGASKVYLNLKMLTNNQEISKMIFQSNLQVDTRLILPTEWQKARPFT